MDDEADFWEDRADAMADLLLGIAGERNAGTLFDFAFPAGTTTEADAEVAGADKSVKYSDDQPRQLDGRFGSGGGGSSADATANRPSKPDERHADAKPEVKAWKAPPPKTGKVGGGPVQRPTGDASQTKQGDIAEAAAASIGMRNILPEGKRNFTPAEVAAKGSSIDLEYDHSGRLYELKMCKSTATEYRLKAKAEEKEAKAKYAKHVEGEVYTLVGVHDVKNDEVHFYGSKEPGLTGAEVGPEKFDYLGKAKWKK